LLFLAAPYHNRYAGIAYAVGGLSVAGIPPVAGFWSKTAVLQVSLACGSGSGRAVLAGVVVLGGLLSLLYMFQSYGRTYWHALAEPVDPAGSARTAIVVASAALTLAIGIWPEPLIALSERAAAVLQGGTP
jgi:multicomponent Na+:H+ antiporter subunit D